MTILFVSAPLRGVKDVLHILITLRSMITIRILIVVDDQASGVVEV
jgi:hypothetical protein